jgi:hypothetical protein
MMVPVLMSLFTPSSKSGPVRVVYAPAVVSAEIDALASVETVEAAKVLFTAKSIRPPAKRN